ncbi:unnamed protein product [Closterium sp. NIES-53]
MSPRSTAVDGTDGDGKEPLPALEGGHSSAGPTALAVNHTSSATNTSSGEIDTNTAAMEKFASENERSLTALLRFLNSLAPHNVEHPAAGTLDLTFHIRSREEIQDQKEGVEESADSQKEGGGEVAGGGKNEGLEKLRKVQLRIRTTGGNCKDLVGRQLSAFFQDCGVSSEFLWPKGYWDLLSPAAIAHELAKEDAKAAAASAEVAAIQQQQKQEAKKNHPRLEAALDAINDGWKVGESVKRMWAGERDVRKLCLGLDEGSAKMVARVLVHVQGNDKEHGKMVYVVEGMEGEKEIKDGVSGDEEGGEAVGKGRGKKGSLKIEII